MKNKSAIALLLGSNVVSGLSQGMTMTTIPLYFNCTSEGSSNTFMIFYLLATFVTLFWTPYAGVLVDRYNRQSIFKAMNLICGGTLGAAYIASLVFPEFTPIMAIIAFALAFWNNNIYGTAFYSFLQEIAEPTEYRKLAGIIEIQAQASLVLSGTAAGLLFVGGSWDLMGLLDTPIQMPQLDLKDIIGLNVFAYFTAYMGMSAIRYQPVKQHVCEGGCVLTRFNEGWQWLRNNRAIFWFGILSLPIFILVMLGTHTLYPIYTKTHLHSAPTVFIWVQGAYVVGALLAAAFIQRLFRWTTCIQAIIILSLVTAFKCIYLMFDITVAWFYAMGFVLGVANSGIRVFRASFLLQHLPNQIAGRIHSLFSLGNTILRLAFLAIFSLPFFHQFNHIIWAFGILAAFFVLAAIGLSRVPRMLAALEEENLQTQNALA